MSGSQGSNRRRAGLRLLLFLASVLANALLLWHFHDRYWYPTDDGFYAHVAERVLDGEVLNRDIQDIHPGYVTFLHALAFRLFGLDLVSLRYPLVLASLLLGCFTYAVLQRRSLVLAALASVATTALGVLQFMDPTANWYCLPLTVLLALWMIELPVSHPARLPGAGVIVGVLAMFRHLSGAWAAMGLIVVVLLERSSNARGRDALLARVLAATMLAAVVGGLALTTHPQPGGMLLISVWPIAILAWMVINLRVFNGDVCAIAARLLPGAAAATLPLLVYHWGHGSLMRWLRDIVGAAVGETELPFFDADLPGGLIATLVLAGAYQTTLWTDPVKIVNGLYWVVLPLISAINGVLIMRALRKDARADDLVVPVLASFYALVSVYLEGPLYLYYSVGLSLLAVLWFNATGARASRVAGMAVTAAVTVVAIVFHAGQSRDRTLGQILTGSRESLVWATAEAGLQRSSLQMSQADRRLYGRLVSVIQAETRPDESILALPNDAELYFLTSRRNPTRFYNAALGMTNAAERDDVMSILTTSPPRMVIFRPSDKYITPSVRQIMGYVGSTYEKFATIGEFDLYRLPSPRDGGAAARALPDL